MTKRSESDRSPKPSPISEGRERKRDNSADGRSRGSGSPNLLWRVLFILTTAFVTGALVFLWPMFKAAGPGITLFMVVAVLASSLTPLLLLRKILNRESPQSGKESHEEEQIL